MKKLFRFIIIPALMLLLLLCSACSPSPATDSSSDRITVITTIFPPYDFVREIAGDSVDVSMLLPPGAESHSFEPTPRDIIAIQGCDLFIYAGGESDAWVEDMLVSMGDDAPATLTLMECVEPVEEELSEGMEHHHDDDAAHDDNEIEYDEHVWASPKNAMLICSRITQALSAAAPASADIFNEGCAAYQQKLSLLDELFEEVTASPLRRTIVVGDRFPFRYLTEAYNLEYYAAFPGCSTESEPSAATLAFLIDAVQQNNLPAVFYIEFSNHRVADAIAETTGCETLMLHSCHSVTQADLDSGVSYISLMTQNAENLRKALN